MNSDFSRIITLLRKERNISQKNAASDLGVSQALLSHYEKGIRECGLEFLVRAADYYHVSCDYLLGRSPEPAGKRINYDDIPEHDPNQKEAVLKGGIMASFNKKLIINSLNILFPLAQKTESDTIIKHMSSYLMLAIYRMFRIIYSTNPKNDPYFFTIPDVLAKNGSTAAMEMAEGMASAAASGIKIGTNDCVEENAGPFITTGILTEDFPNYSSSILNLVKNSEAKIQLLNNAEK